MILAIVIAVQLATGSQNSCADQLEALCKVSPYFCAGAYPADLVPGTNGVPCWPERSVAPVASGPASSAPRQTNSINRGRSDQQAAPQPSQQASSQPAARSDPVVLTVLERFTRAIQRLAVRTSSP